MKADKGFFNFSKQTFTNSASELKHLWE